MRLMAGPGRAGRQGRRVATGWPAAGADEHVGVSGYADGSLQQARSLPCDRRRAGQRYGRPALAPKGDRVQGIRATPTYWPRCFPGLTGPRPRAPTLTTWRGRPLYHAACAGRAKSEPLHARGPGDPAAETA